MYHTITLFATLSKVLNESIPRNDRNYGSLLTFISNELQIAT